MLPNDEPQSVWLGIRLAIGLGVFFLTVVIWIVLSDVPRGNGGFLTEPARQWQVPAGG